MPSLNYELISFVILFVSLIILIIYCININKEVKELKEQKSICLTKFKLYLSSINTIYSVINNMCEYMLDPNKLNNKIIEMKNEELFLEKYGNSLKQYSNNSLIRSHYYETENERLELVERRSYLEKIKKQYDDKEK